MKRIELNLFADDRSVFIILINSCNSGCFAIPLAFSPRFGVYDEDFNNKIQVKPWVVNKLVEVGYFKEMKDGRFYKSDDAPEITFKVD